MVTAPLIRPLSFHYNSDGSDESGYFFAFCKEVLLGEATVIKTLVWKPRAES
jgi:hypothetical protein